MTKENCEKGQNLLHDISMWEEKLKAMKHFNENQEDQNIYFGDNNGYVDAATGKACMALMINHAEESLKKLQKEFDKL